MVGTRRARRHRENDGRSGALHPRSIRPVLTTDDSDRRRYRDGPDPLAHARGHGRGSAHEARPYADPFARARDDEKRIIGADGAAPSRCEHWRGRGGTSSCGRWARSRRCGGRRLTAVGEAFKRRDAEAAFVPGERAAGVKRASPRADGAARAGRRPALTRCRARSVSGIQVGGIALTKGLGIGDDAGAQ